MSTEPNGAPQALPDRPNLRHLKDQAKDLLKAGRAASLADAQFQIARLYGFASWPKLKAHRDHRYEISGHAYPGTALDYLIAGYMRSLERLSACIDVLLQAGGETRYNIPAVLAVLGGRLDDLAKLMEAEPGVVNQSFPELNCGQTGGRSLLLQGGTLLHVAAEYGNLAAATLLLERGADVNAPATVDQAGIGGQTAIFHAVTQSGDDGLPVTQLLLERGADLGLRLKLPGGYERPGEIVECTPLGYALLFGGDSQRSTITLLREWGAVQ